MSEIESLRRELDEIKASEAALRKSEAKYRLLIDNVYDLVWTIDVNGIFTYAAPSWKRVLGYEPSDVMGRSMQDFVHADDATTCRSALQNLDHQMSGLVCKVKHADGTWQSHVISATPVFDSNGSFIFAIGNSIDITERQALLERLNRVGKMEALGELAGGVAHDLNNVLGVQVGYSELLVNKISINSPLRKYANNILQSSLRGAAILQDLLTMTRRGVTVSEVINLNHVICNSLSTPEADKLLVYAPRVKIHTKLDGRLLNIQGSPVHLGKAVMNLVSNAVEAIASQGKVTITTESCYLDSPIQGYDELQEGDYAVLKVSDTGIGIPEKDKAMIFEPFYTKKVMGRSGTGLGLTVVWNVVKDHHGYIDVYSTEGEGSTFTLYFPVSRDQTVKNKESLSPALYEGRGETILVVDDDTEQCAVAASMLESLRYRVITVTSGEKAVNCIREQSTDLILLDMIMDPGIDGMETYRRILEINPNQKAVIVSGFSETDQVRKTMAMGAGMFLRKPYVLEEIGEAIRKVLDSDGTFVTTEVC